MLLSQIKFGRPFDNDDGIEGYFIKVYQNKNYIYLIANYKGYNGVIKADFRSSYIALDEWFYIT